MSRSEMFKLAARDIAEMLYSDSRIPVSQSLPLIGAALTRDDRFPTAEEKEVLALGTQDDETVDSVAALFPATVAVIDSFF